MEAKVSVVVSDLSGGGAVRAYLLCQVLQALDFAVEIVGFLFGQHLFAHPPGDISLQVFPGKEYPDFLRSAGRLLQAIDGDIIYAVKPKPTSFGLSILNHLVSKRPIILDMDDWELSWYGGDAWTYRPSLKQLVKDILEPKGALRFPDHPLYVHWLETLLPQANALTVDTHFLQQRFGGVYLPNGKDTNLFDPELFNPVLLRQTFGLADYRILMFPGAPRPHKGVEDVLIALEQLNQPDMRLVIVGGNPYDDYDEQLMARWGKWIIKLPRCSVEKMPALVAAAHVVVVPQRDTVIARAQFPLKLTDGMAMAKPILTTRVGDILEIVDDTGYLVEPESPQQIATAIQQIFQDWSTAEQRGQLARKRCVEHYSVEAMAPILDRVITPLLNS
ncbi:MAG: glycosyltransferase family 4 protein [Chroococcidiopsidaceae cyanobacterium CP_BM_RX_35]|nr:glycosyltransferase family 4 protein [Chroococcidiopsidaceae cyanobacterium CP_BM_RX_35]